MRRRTPLSLLFACLVPLVGCASSAVHTLSYHAAPIEDLGGERTVLMYPVRESRPQVVLENEPPSWIGDERLGYALPRQIATHDGKALARVVQEWIVRDLDAAGFDVVIASDDRPVDPAELAADLRTAGAERAVFIDILEFASRTFRDVAVHWNLLAEVFAPDGTKLAVRHLQGHTERQGSLVNPPATARQEVPLIFAELMRKLVRDDAELMAALTGD
jgi:hypothetical protein